MNAELIFNSTTNKLIWVERVVLLCCCDLSVCQGRCLSAAVADVNVLSLHAEII